jgi:NADPH2:quinone reductase
VSVVGIHWGAYTSQSTFFPFERSIHPWFIENEPARAVQVWKELLALMGSNRVRPVVFDKIYTLDTLVQGLDDLEKRRTWGKAVVRVQDAEEKENAKL